MTVDLAILDRRLTLLEAIVSSHDGTLPDVHEIETMPCLSQDQSGTDMRTTHETAAKVNKVYVVPFRFSGKMFLRRMSMVCAAEVGQVSTVGLCLYRLEDLGRVSQLDPRGKSLPEMRKVGRGSWAATDGTTQVRLDINFPREHYLNTSQALYFAGWTCDTRFGTVFCPNSGASTPEGSKSFRAAFTTTGTASPTAGFPDRLSITGDTAGRTAPCVVGRSLTGIRIFGSFTDDV